MVASQILLQKPHCSSKARDHVAALSRRLDAWQEGDLREGRAIQSHLSLRRMKDERGDKIARVFSRLMLEGKTRAALRYLSENEQHGVLSLDEPCGSRTVRDILHEKHRVAQPVQPEALIVAEENNMPTIHPVLFERITRDTIRSSALRTEGSAGPSGIDAAGWRRLLVSFHRESKDLCSAVAGFTLRL